ncbi:uncharacterized protein A4U43_C01F19670 [Asparagus officinalis]|uniref:Uncharacterized protein n=1 Tax=Asparagus officinalis TaxID=4686 RepID=A0A5P1FRG6_ASPOF|nr:uncharacterized protein A4U43_C01F19670 [Asparagus officinalis]
MTSALLRRDSLSPFPKDTTRSRAFACNRAAASSNPLTSSRALLQRHQLTNLEPSKEEVMGIFTVIASATSRSIAEAIEFILCMDPFSYLARQRIYNPVLAISSVFEQEDAVLFGELVVLTWKNVH